MWGTTALKSGESVAVLRALSLSGGRVSRRPPVRRTRKSPKRVPAPTKPRGPQPLVLGMAAAAGVGFCGAVGQWLLGNWWLLAVLAAVVAGAVSCSRSGR